MRPVPNTRVERTVEQTARLTRGAGDQRPLSVGR